MWLVLGIIVTRDTYIVISKLEKTETFWNNDQCKFSVIKEICKYNFIYFFSEEFHKNNRLLCRANDIYLKRKYPGNKLGI